MNINSLCTDIIKKTVFNRSVLNIAAEKDGAFGNIFELTVFYMEAFCVFIRNTGLGIVGGLTVFALGKLVKSVGTEKNIFK